MTLTLTQWDSVALALAQTADAYVVGDKTGDMLRRAADVIEQAPRVTRGQVDALNRAVHELDLLVVDSGRRDLSRFLTKARAVWSILNAATR